MANSFETISHMVTAKALERVQNTSAMINRVTHEFDDQYGRSGHKIGSTLYIRLPNRYYSQTDVDVSLAIQDVTDPTAIALTLDQVANVPIGLLSSEYALSFDDIDERYVKPASDSISAAVDNALCAKGAVAFPNVVGSGAFLNTISMAAAAPGTPLTSASATSAFKAFGAANAMLHNLGVPQSDRYAIVDPMLHMELVDQVVGNGNNTGSSSTGRNQQYNPSSTISKMWKSGQFGDALGLEWAMDQAINSQTSGIAGAASTLVNVGGGVVDGATTVAYDAAHATTTFAIGDIVAFGGTAGVSGGAFAVNPLTRAALPYLQTFVVTAAVGAGATGTLSISPAIRFHASSGAARQYQNVSVLPANNALVYAWGVNNATTYSAKTFANSLVYHKSAIALGIYELPVYENQTKMARVTDRNTHVSLRFWQQPQALTDKLISRLEMRYGVAAPQPMYGVRVIN